MTKSPEQLNKPKEFFDGDEAGRISDKLEEKNEEDRSLSQSWKDPEEFKKAVKETLQELREESKKAREEAILKKLEEMIEEDPSLKETWDENPEELQKAREEISKQLWKEAESNNKE